MWNRLRTWGYRSLREIKDNWWLWFLLLIFRIFEDRVIGWINTRLDSLGYKLWPTVKVVLQWLGPFGVTGLIFVLVLVVILIHAYFETRSDRTVAQTAQLDQPPRQSDHVEFYKNRGTAPPLRELFGNCRSVWCLFQTGTIIKETDFLTWAKINQAVLIHPDGEYIETHIRIRDSRQSFVSEIQDITAKLQKPGISVWWYDGPIPNSMILGDAEPGNDGIIQIEISYPYSNTDERPILIVRRRDSEEVFDNLRKQYWEIINKATPPSTLRTNQIKQSPLQIEFSDHYFDSKEEKSNAGLGLSGGRRKTFWIEVHNPSPKDVTNVSVDIKRIVKIDPTGEENILISASQLGRHRLQFKYGLAYQMDFPPNRKERVDIVSYSNAFMEKQHFRIEGDGAQISNPFNCHKIEIEVTAKGMPPKTREFFVYVDPQGEFKMITCKEGSL